MLGLPGVWAAAAGIALTAITGWLAVSSSDVRSLIISRYEEALRIELPRTSAEEYEDLLLEQLQDFKRQHKHCRRLVIFVDDLDRLSAEEMVSGLDAVRTFMELPVDRLPEDLGVVFVISCDEDRVAAALEARRRQGAPALPAVVLDRMDARRFLDRIFQFRIEIPPFPSQDLRTFAKQRLQSDMSDIADDLQRWPGHRMLDDVVDRMIHVNVQDPRNALQILNAFSQSWRLAKLRERAGVGDGRPGGLQSGAITGHPEALAALCALRVNFPDFYADLQAEPELIGYFTALFLRGSHEGIPDRARTLLRNYQALTSDGAEVSPAHVKAMYHGLRQYLVSLQGMRWPTSLQPLLLLAQDPISGRFGDRARLVLDALVSADDRGILVLLGREHDTKPLNPDDIQLLRDLQAHVVHDTEIRRNNAAAAIAGLVDRLPNDDARSLLAPVARRFVAASELRWRVGLERIGRALPFLDSDDRQDVAGCLIQDLMPVNDHLHWRTEAGETPTLAEASTMIDTTVPLILEVWRKDGLSAPDRSQLVEWLQARVISVPQGRASLPHHQLESWMSQAENVIVGALAGEYPRLVADALDDDQDAEFDIETAMQRCSLVFDQLWETNRSDLWTLLTRFVGLRRAEATSLAWRVVLKHLTGPDGATMTEFATAFANRLIRDEEDEAWGLTNWRDAGQAFLRLLEVRASDLDEQAWRECVSLAQHWSDDQSTEHFAVTLLGLLERQNPASADQVIANWTERLTTDLSPECMNWLGMHFADRLSEEQRSALTKELGTVLANANPTDQDIATLRCFVAALTAEGAEHGEAQELLVAALQHLTTWSHNPNGYVDGVFPVIADLIPHARLSLIDTTLMRLFRQVRSRGQIDVLGVLHGAMVGNWPLPQEGETYDPVELFDQASATISGAQSTDAGVSLIRSMADMVHRGVVPSASIKNVVDGACDLWRNHPGPVAEILLSVQVAPDPSQLLALGQRTDLDVADDLARLRQVWTHAAAQMDNDERFETAQALLADVARGIKGEPDLLLGAWVGVQGEGSTKLLMRLAEAEEFTDEQRARVWLQADRYVADLDPKVVLLLLAEMLRPDIEERTLQQVLNSKSAINERLGSQEQQFDLAKVLLNALVESESANAQQHLATWLKEKRAQAILAELDGMDGVTLNHIALLETQFKNNKHLKRLREKLKSLESAREA